MAPDIRNDALRGARDEQGSVARAEEAALVARAQAGEREAFEELVRQNADRLYAVVLRFTADAQEAEETTQEAFLRAWRSIGRFRGDARFFTWLYRIGINEAKRRAERRPAAGRVVSLDEPAFDEPPDPTAGPQERAQQADLRDEVERALRQLPDDYREAVLLRDVQGLSTEEAAQAVGLKQRAFKSRLHRARLALRDLLSPYVEQDDDRR